ncbi:phospholipase A2 inhibitor NAI-like [Mantella aurantiaca]
MERSVLLFAGILCSLVTTGFSLSCSVCYEEDEKSCKGTSMPCLSDTDVCVATYEANTIDTSGEKLLQYSRSCGPRTSCAQKESSTFSDGSVQISSTCCFTNNCIPPTPVLPQTKTEKNGVSCMECRGAEDKPCTSSTYMACTGNEKQCVSVIVTTPSFSAVSLSGCGTPGLCNISQLYIKTGETKEQMKFSCPSGGSTLHGLLLLVFVPMLLVKVIG